MPESRPLPSVQLNAVSEADSVQPSDVLVIGIGQDLAIRDSVKVADDLTGGAIGRMIGSGEISGKKGESLLVPGGASGGPDLILIIGTGEQVDRGVAFEVAATAIRQIAKRERRRIVLAIDGTSIGDVGDAIVAGALSGCETQAIYQTGGHAFFPPASIDFVGLTQTQIDRGRVIGESMNFTRRLVNEPASAVYPESFVSRVTKHFAGTSLQIEAWDEHRLESEGCRAILAVGQGSVRPPRLLIIRHQGGPQDQAPLALVGKGVTFDSGGLSIKPSEGMVDMKCDMAGAATVVGVMKAIAELKVPRNVIGFCGLAENMVSGDSYKLGDVIETRSGKTIEILNTDAEGRVVLADTLDVAIQHHPGAMIDLATLTGACMVALGNEVAGLMTNSDDVCRDFRGAAEAEGEPVWQLPMFSLYDEKVKSKVADIKNVGEGRWGGAITAAKFLENFVGDTPWVHIDIAGPAFVDSPLPHRDAGATGVMVRSLVRWIENS